MKSRPMTDAEQKFAADNHDLVYAFLNRCNLSETSFYDVVIFGYLRSVQEYFERPNLRQYAFSTLAWKRMQSALSNHRRYLGRLRRSAPTISLDDYVDEEKTHHISDIVSYHNDIAQQIETNALLDELTGKLPPRTMRIIRMKIEGYKMHDIAKAEHITFRTIKRLLEDSYDTVIEICYER